MNEMHAEFQKTISPELRLISYRDIHRDHFKRLNEQWISKSFVLEDSDIAVLTDPKTHILSGGGAILLAEYKGMIAGTCAIISEGDGIYELTKMAVDEKYRGLKIGYHLGVGIIEKSKQLGAKMLVLHSNKKGSAEAIQLYYKLGFIEVPLEPNAPWARADIKMELNCE
jgi:GNAT superfamily N-acetyltransferase